MTEPRVTQPAGDPFFEVLAGLAGLGLAEVVNARGEFACNSSSSHSIVVLPSGMTLANDDEDGCYGTSNFTLTDSTSKIRYLAAMLSGKRALKPLAAELREGIRWDASDAVDHESVLRFPQDRFGNVEEEFIRDVALLLSDPSVAILGGSDNDSGHPVAGDDSVVALPLPSTTGWTVRKDTFGGEAWWVLFNTTDGTKLRMRLGRPVSEDPSFSYVPEKAPLPELVDVKLTDRCVFEKDCGFCFSGETEYLTLDGVRTFAETVGTVQKVLVSTAIHGTDSKYALSDFGGEWRDAEIRSFGVQRLMKVTLRRFNEEKVVYATPEHRWLYTPPRNSRGDEKVRRIALTSELKESMRLAPLFPKSASVQGSESAVPSAHGTHAGWTVVSVEETDRVEEVFCAVVPGHENFTLEGNINVMNCYTGSTVKGPEGDPADVMRLVSALAELQVFEVAFGGGEPTMWPHFEELLRFCRSLGVVPNFTTKNYTVFKRDPTLLQLAGSVAVSVNDEASLKRLDKALAGVSWWEGRDKVSVQVIPEIVSDTTLEKILAWAVKENTRVTFLGYKTTGRGNLFDGRISRPDGFWIPIAQRFGSDLRLAIDTVLAERCEADLRRAGVPDWCYHTVEGKFSLYVDAVKGSLGPSSYCEDEHMLPLDLAADADDLAEAVRSSFTGF